MGPERNRRVNMLSDDEKIEDRGKEVELLGSDNIEDQGNQLSPIASKSGRRSVRQLLKSIR